MRSGARASHWSVISGGHGEPLGRHHVVLTGERFAQHWQNNQWTGAAKSWEPTSEGALNNLIYVWRGKGGRWWKNYSMTEDQIMGEILYMVGQLTLWEESLCYEYIPTIGHFDKSCNIGQRWSRLGEDEGGQESPHRRQNILPSIPKNHILWCHYSQNCTSSPWSRHSNSLSYTPNCS